MPLIRDAETGRGNNTHKYSLRHNVRTRSALLKQKIDASCVRNKLDFLLSLGLNANVIPSSLRKTHSDQYNNNLMECSVVIETVKCIICESYFKCRTDLIDHWKMEKCNMAYMRQCRVSIVGTKCKVCGRSFKCITDAELHMKTKHRIRKRSKATVIIKIGEEVMSKVCVRKKHLKAYNINSGMLSSHWKWVTSRDAKIAEDEALNSFFQDYYVSQKETECNGDISVDVKSKLDDQATHCESTYNSRVGETCDNVRIKEEKSDFNFSTNGNILVKYEEHLKTNSIFTFDGDVGSDYDSEHGQDKFDYSVGNDSPLLNDDMLNSEFDKMSDIERSDQNHFEMGYQENLQEIRDAHTVPCLYNEILMMDDEVLLLEDFENMERAKNEFLKTDSTMESKRRMSLSDVSSTLSDAERFDDDEVVELIRIFNPTTNCGGREINEVSPTRRERELLMRCNIPETLDSYEDSVRLQNENMKIQVKYSNSNSDSALKKGIMLDKSFG